MKKSLLAATLLLVTFSGFSQTLNVHKTDGSVTSINLGQIEKITFSLSGESSFTDLRDNHVYGIVTIGSQTWMAENLAYLPEVNPSANGSDTEEFYYVYGYQGTSVSAAKDSVNYTTFGVLYNWTAASTACPAGWHLPSDPEWTALISFLGVDSGIKAKSTTGWFDNRNGNNSSGFNGRPAGTRSKAGTFSYLGSFGYYWSSTVLGTTRSNNTYLSYDLDIFGRDVREHGNGFSVRCLKD